MASVGQSSMPAVLAAALAVFASGVASADAPSRVVGTVTDFHGKYGVVVRDARGRVIDVALHQGTIIKPEGLRLERGMVLTIIGQAGDRAFAATEIDTAYQLPPSRSPKATASVAGPIDALAPQPVGDSSRFNSTPGGDLNAPRVPAVPPARAPGGP